MDHTSTAMHTVTGAYRAYTRVFGEGVASDGRLEAYSHLLSAIDDIPDKGQLMVRCIEDGLCSPMDEVRQVALQYYERTLRQGDYSTRRRLISMLTERGLDDDVRSILLRFVLDSIRNDHCGIREQSIPVLEMLRSLFEMPMSEQMTESVAIGLLSLYNPSQRARSQTSLASRIVNDLINDWLLDYLRKQTIPLASERALAAHLGSLSLWDVSDELLSVVLERLRTESNRSRVAAILRLVTKWYAAVQYSPELYDRAFRHELDSYVKGRQSAGLSARTRRIVQVNEAVLLPCAQILLEWQDDETLVDLTSALLAELPTGRVILQNPEIAVLLETVLTRDQTKPFIQKASLRILTSWLSLLAPVLPQALELLNTSKDQDTTTSRRLISLNRWAHFDYDQKWFSLIYQIIGDEHRPLHLRRDALQCVTTIAPLDIHEHFMNYTGKHSSSDPLLPSILEFIANSGGGEYWRVCVHYLTIIRIDEKIDWRNVLLAAAARTKHPAIIPALLEHCFQSSDKQTQEYSLQLLRQCGFGAYHDLEVLRRDIRNLDADILKQTELLRMVKREDYDNRHSLRYLQQDNAKGRANFDQTMLQLEAEISDSQVFNTEKTIRFAQMDKELEALNREIAKLTTRRNHLEVRVKSMYERISQLQREVETLQKRIQDLTTLRNQIEARLCELRRQIDTAIRNLQLAEDDRDSAKEHWHRTREELSERIHDAEYALDTQRTEFSRLESEHSDTSHRARNAHERIHEIERTCILINSEISRLERRLRSLTEDDIEEGDSIEEQLRELGDQLSHLTYAREETQNIAYSLSSECDTLSISMHSYQSNISEILDTIRSAQDRIRTSQTRFEIALTKFENSQDECDRLQRDGDRCVDQAESLEHQQNECAALLSSLQVDIARFVEEKSEIEENELRPTIIDLEAAIKEHKRISQRLTREMEKLDSHRARMTVRRNTLHSALNSHNQVLCDVEKRLIQIGEASEDAMRRENTLVEGLCGLQDRLKFRQEQYMQLRTECEEVSRSIFLQEHERSIFSRANQSENELQRMELVRLLDMAYVKGKWIEQMAENRHKA